MISYDKTVVDEQKLLIQGLDTLAIKVSRHGRDNLLLYSSELQKWNKRINLIARNTPPGEIIEKHFLDSLTLLPCIAKLGINAPALLDVGTGAGFPGLVLAAVMPELAVTLVEPRQKRVNFLQHIIRTLQLPNVRVIADRLEQAGLHSHDFSCITSRAVADVDGFLSLVKDITGPKTVVITMQATDERDLWAGGKRTENWQLLRQVMIKLPFSGAPRVLSMIGSKTEKLDR